MRSFPLASGQSWYRWTSPSRTVAVRCASTRTVPRGVEMSTASPSTMPARAASAGLTSQTGSGANWRIQETRNILLCWNMGLRAPMLSTSGNSAATSGADAGLSVGSRYEAAPRILRLRFERAPRRRIPVCRTAC